MQMHCLSRAWHGWGRGGSLGFQYGALPPDVREEPPLPPYWLQTTFKLCWWNESYCVVQGLPLTAFTISFCGKVLLWYPSAWFLRPVLKWFSKLIQWGRWLSDTVISYNSVVDCRSQEPIFCSLCSYAGRVLKTHFRDHINNFQGPSQ